MLTKRRLPGVRGFGCRIYQHGGVAMGKRILMVDDEPQVLKLFRSILERAGYTIETAICGRDAIQLLKTCDVDLLVLDLNMPEPDGFELLRELRTSMPGLRIVVISGFLEGALLEAAGLLGATATISKTDAPEMLVPIVNDLLRMRALA